jgi:hypothetical protein
VDPPDLAALEDRHPDVPGGSRDDGRVGARRDRLPHCAGRALEPPQRVVLVVRHVRVLTDAGFLESRRDGWYVLYSLRSERLAALSAELLGYVTSGPGAEAPGP